MNFAHLVYQHWFISLILIVVPTLVLGEAVANIVVAWRRKP